jgi:hypothetical protein
MIKSMLKRGPFLAVLTAPLAFGSPAVAQEQAAGGAVDDAMADVGEMTCAHLMGFAPPDLERMVYYIAGYEAGLRDTGGADGATDEAVTDAADQAEDPADGEAADRTVAPDGTGDRPADPAADPRLTQIQPAEPGAGLEIDLERLQATCQENSDRLARDVVHEVRTAAGGDGDR